MTNTTTMTHTNEKEKLKNVVISQRNRTIQIVNGEIKQLNALETASEKYFSEIKKHSNDFELTKTVNKISREVKVVVGGTSILVDVIEENYNTCQIVYVGKLPEGRTFSIVIGVKEHITYSRGGWTPNRQGLKLYINLGDKEIYYKCARSFVKKVDEYIESIWDSYNYSLRLKDNKEIIKNVAVEKFGQNSIVTLMISTNVRITYDNGVNVELYSKINNDTKEVSFTIKEVKISTPSNQDDLMKLIETLGKL